MKQIAAIPYKKNTKGNLEILLITSRETHRWVLPKGWRMDGIPDHTAAGEEALQEAGVSGHVHHTPFGRYDYFKRLQSTFELVEVSAFLMRVDEELPEWREQGQRKRKWFSAGKAHKKVEEPGLMTLLAALRSPAAIE